MHLKLDSGESQNVTKAHHLRPYVALPIQLHLSQFHLNPVHHLQRREQRAPQLFDLCLNIDHLPATQQQHNTDAFKRAQKI
jgi:hypothetical protein